LKFETVVGSDLHSIQQKVDKKAVKICKLSDAGKPTSCKAAKSKKGKYGKSLGKVTMNTAGQYVCVHSEDGVDTVSDPMTVVVKAKEPKEEKVKPEKEKKEKKKKGSI